METKSNPIVASLQSIADALFEAAHRAAAPGSVPDLSAYFEAQALVRSESILDRLQEDASVNPEAFSSILVRMLATTDRARARLARYLGAAPAPVPATERDEACRFLESELASGEKSAKDLISRGRALGLSPRTLYRAKSELGIDSVQRASPDNVASPRTWYWALPAALPTSA